MFQKISERQENWHSTLIRASAYISESLMECLSAMVKIVVKFVIPDECHASDRKPHFA